MSTWIIEQDPACPDYPQHGGITVQTDDGLVCVSCGRLVTMSEEYDAEEDS